MAVTESKCMPCYNPLIAYRRYDNKVVINRLPSVEWESNGEHPFNIPCGKCIGCRLNYAREWALRCIHEARTHDHNSFITLTFNKEHLPKDGSLNVATFQRFMKRLRAGTKKKNLRFFHSGEYGEKFRRPHYHALIFGYDFPDKKLFQKNKDPALNLYTSQELSKYWPYGFSTIGNLTYESASYTARYILKKINGDMAKDHYAIKDDDGKITGYLNPEYCTMSRVPGLGTDWYKEFGWSDCHANDRCAVLRNGKTYYSRPPRFYDDILKSGSRYKGKGKTKGCWNIFPNPKLFEKIKKKRLEKQDDPIIYKGKHGRLKTKEEVKTLQIEKILRNLEVDI